MLLERCARVTTRATTSARRRGRTTRTMRNHQSRFRAFGSKQTTEDEVKYYESLVARDRERASGDAEDAPSCALDIHADRASDFEAIMLVVGTTVGGGFLAMPFFASPAGFVPATAISVVAWAALAASGIMVSEALTRTWARSNGRAVSLLSATADYCGPVWANVTAVSFLVMMNLTLVSQLAKCGALASFFSGGAISHIAGAFITAAVFGAVSFSKSAAKVNAVATVGIFMSFLAICIFGVQNLEPSKLGFMNFSAALPALPGLVALYTYGECLPTIVDMLRGDRTRIRKVIIQGTLVPLGMYTMWLMVSLAQTGAWAGNADLAQTMLESGGILGFATASVAITASVSTLIGGYLALSRFCADALKKKSVAQSKSVVALTLIPSLLVAFKGPEVYFSAIKFSGAIVSVILWGLIPPMMAHSLWEREGTLSIERKTVLSAWTALAYVALFFGTRSVMFP